MNKFQNDIDRETLSDEELMELYISSDYMAFEMLYKRHSSRIFQYLKAKVGDEIGQELLQETFARVHKFREKYNSQYPFLPWIFTILRNLLKDYYKKNETQRVQKSVSIDHNHVAVPQSSEFGNLEHLEEALSILPDQQKTALKLRYLDDWSFEKIASEMETSPQNVRQLVSRGLKKVKLALSTQGGSK